MPPKATFSHGDAVGCFEQTAATALGPERRRRSEELERSHLVLQPQAGVKPSPSTSEHFAAALLAIKSRRNKLNIFPVDNAINAMETTDSGH
jgi:hypothetical protein